MNDAPPIADVEAYRRKREELARFIPLDAPHLLPVEEAARLACISTSSVQKLYDGGRLFGFAFGGTGKRSARRITVGSLADLFLASRLATPEETQAARRAWLADLTGADLAAIRPRLELRRAELQSLAGAPPFRECLRPLLLPVAAPLLTIDEVAELADRSASFVYGFVRERRLAGFAFQCEEGGRPIYRLDVEAVCRWLVEECRAKLPPAEVSYILWRWALELPEAEIEPTLAIMERRRAVMGATT